MKLKLKVITPPREYDNSLREMMDEDHPDPELLKDDLANIRNLNRFFGAYRLISSELSILKQKFESEFQRDITILDFCTGSGDIPRHIVNWGRENGVHFKITATDINPVMLEESKVASSQYPEISFAPSNILKPDFPEESFDFVFCNLALHHFPTEQAVQAVANMWRIARHGIIINDLERSKFLLRFTKPFINFISKNEMTRFDAVLSVKRAFAKEEMLRLAFHARLPEPEHRRYFLSRQVLAAYK